MASTKHWKYSERLLALHEEWAVKNGYRDKPQAASAKLQAASDMLNAVNSERFVESAKPQATSVKLQASNGTSSNKR